VVQDGVLGTIFHAGLHWNGSYTRPPEQPESPPPDLDWELFQGPAPRHPYTRNRQRSWRSFYDYGGGIITDQGVHIGDVVHWALNAREPLSVTASGQYVSVQRPELDQPPDSWMITWKYDKFVMSYTNAYMPQPEFDNSQGNYFFGSLGTMHVSRSGYNWRPLPSRPAPGGPPPAPPFEAVNERIKYIGTPADIAHIRNFLDCVKSRQKPLTDIETGFYSTLPLILGVMAVRYGKMYTWNGREAKS
jgi:predicted dehydrogenase